MWTVLQHSCKWDTTQVVVKYSRKIVHLWLLLISCIVGDICFLKWAYRGWQVFSSWQPLTTRRRRRCCGYRRGPLCLTASLHTSVGGRGLSSVQPLLARTTGTALPQFVRRSTEWQTSLTAQSLFSCDGVRNPGNVTEKRSCDVNNMFYDWGKPECFSPSTFRTCSCYLMPSIWRWHFMWLLNVFSVLK